MMSINPYSILAESVPSVYSRLCIINVGFNFFWNCYSNDTS